MRSELPADYGYFILCGIQVHEARSTKSLRLFGQVDNANAELRGATESPLLEKSSQLHRTAELERRRSAGRRQKPALQEMPFRQVSEEERRLSSDDDARWRQERPNDAEIRRAAGKRRRQETTRTGSY